MSTRRRATLVLLAASAAFAVGCGNSQQSRLNAYRSNPSPEVDTLAQTHDDIDNRLTVTNDTNLRMLNEDIGRALFLNRPSRLSPKNIPY